MERINYSEGKPTWSWVERKDGSKQLKLTLRYYDDGKRRSRAKRFSVADSTKLDTDRKKDNALRAWIKELEAEQDKLIKEEREREQAEAEAAKLASLPSATSTVAEYISSFIDDLEASGHIERSTVYSYRRFARAIAVAFPRVRLIDLTTTMVQKWENGLIADGYSTSTVTKYHRLLSMTCKHAVMVDDLVKNPCQAVKAPKQQAPSPNALDVEGFARLAVTLDAMQPSQVVTAAYIAMFTGMRNGEVCGLRWREYDAANHTITVTEAIGSAGGSTFSKSPKTKVSRRTIPVAPRLADMLERRRAAMVAELQTKGVELTPREFGELFVIGDVAGRYMNPTTLTRAWKSLAETFGLVGTQGRRVTFHDLRHSFATVAIAAGADVKAVAANLGHTNAAMTLNIYADASPRAKQIAINQMGVTVEALGEVEPYAENANALPDPDDANAVTTD